MNVLLAETEPAYVNFKFDTFWLKLAGRDAVCFIRKHADRTRFIHAKDLRKRDQQDVPAGQGNVDFGTLPPLCAMHGWPAVLEYEGPDAVACVPQGASYLRSLA